MVPHCGVFLSTPCESIAIPRNPFPSRNRFRFLLHAPSVPSVPMKLGSEPQTETVTCLFVRFRST